MIEKILKSITWKHIKCMTICMIIYVINQTLLKKYSSEILHKFCTCYLNDLICPLFFLGYCQVIFIWAKNEIKSYFLLLLLGMSAGFIWEYFAPIINSKAVTDPIDLIFYFIGINIYYAIIKLTGKNYQMDITE